MATPDAAASVATESKMVVVTPTYAPDLELFSDLHQSVLRCFPADVRHVAVVPETDLPLSADSKDHDAWSSEFVTSCPGRCWPCLSSGDEAGCG